MAFEKGGEMAWSLSINNIVIDWLDPPLVEVVICCIVVDWGHEGHYVNVIILLYYYTHMRLDVKSYMKLYVKVWCEWVICEGMMWMSFMWSYMWRYDVNEFMWSCDDPIMVYFAYYHEMELLCDVYGFHASMIKLWRLIYICMLLVGWFICISKLVGLSTLEVHDFIYMNNSPSCVW